MPFAAGSKYGGKRNGSGRPNRVITKELFKLYPRCIEILKENLNTTGNGINYQRLRHDTAKFILNKFAPDLASVDLSAKLNGDSRINAVIDVINKRFEGLGKGLDNGGAAPSPSGTVQGQT